MLDTDTKRRIDTARDILVGKVPDPKSQVEQITIALIYKFMDDMDAEAEELGGKRKFFAKDFARYGWAKLMRSGLGGHETLSLYGEAIAKMPENPGIPPLFRDIFKNAYLPYRDPETLRAFLKIIDEFTYDHSERLGDAFEYLLSVLGSQGDAGQFRTPRHIIDFIVSVVDPKKNETVLDPACGTAGFLISSYKHILKANADAKGHSRLTPDEKGRVAKNFKGYDISPDMVRLSLVNLYLHGFTDPHIYEYDTLTSEERWNEFADVILANPPFMSPKGGIKPHKRFSIQAKRSEVLFVDYMAEHLTPNGRAGIIVPEGIIFQSQTAYKELRKMLVENSLVTVISLPAGCFNPYSGVKTSILILDKSLARQSDTIAFFKVENDGFGLGAQRRAFDKNDLPQVKAELDAYLHTLHSRKPTIDLHPTCGLIVPKEKIVANGDYNLSGERYRESSEIKRSFTQVELGTICKPEYGFTASAADNGDVRFVRITDIGSDGRIRKEDPKYINLNRESEQYKLKKGDLLVARTGATFGKTMLFDEDYPAVFASYLIRLKFPKDRLLPEFYWAFAQTEKYWEQARNLATGGGQPQFNGNALTQIKIPLPPLEVQKEIVAEIESHQKVINGARAVLDSYRPYIPIHPDWPMVELGEIADVQLGKMLDQAKHNSGSLFPYARNVSVRWGSIDAHDLPQMYFEDDELERFGLRQGDVLVCEGGEPGRAAVWNGSIPALKYQKALHRVRFTVPYEPTLLVFFLQGMAGSDQFKGWLSGTTIKHLTLDSFKKLRIPIPPLATQQAIVAEIEAEQALVAANRDLITRFKKKIQSTLARVWGKKHPTGRRREPWKKLANCSYISLANSHVIFFMLHSLLSDLVILLPILMALYVEIIPKGMKWYRHVFAVLGISTACIAIRLHQDEFKANQVQEKQIQDLRDTIINKGDEIVSLYRKLLGVTSEEAALAFEPQIIVSYHDTLFKIENLGKSTVCILGINLNGGERDTYPKPQCIIPNSNMTWYPKPFEGDVKNNVGPNGRRDLTAQILIKNQRGQFYLSEWLLEIFVMDGKITVNASENHTFRIKRTEWPG